MRRLRKFTFGNNGVESTHDVLMLTILAVFPYRYNHNNSQQKTHGYPLLQMPGRQKRSFHSLLAEEYHTVQIMGICTHRKPVCTAILVPETVEVGIIDCTCWYGAYFSFSL